MFVFPINDFYIIKICEEKKQENVECLIINHRINKWYL